MILKLDITNLINSTDHDEIFDDGDIKKYKKEIENHTIELKGFGKIQKYDINFNIEFILNCSYDNGGNYTQPMTYCDNIYVSNDELHVLSEDGNETDIELVYDEDKICDEFK